VIIKYIFNLISVLNGDGSPRQIAAGMALGALAGITPLMSLHNLIVGIAILVFQVNFSAALFAMAVFKVISPLADPLFNQVGYALLVKAGALKPLWTALYNTPIVPWSNFNNTLTLGSLAVALILLLPLYFLFVKLIVLYRVRVMERLNKLKIMQVIKASKVYNLYQTYKSYVP
jgi:uncharacterized protein (TIGR03546 family)